MWHLSFERSVDWESAIKMQDRLPALSSRCHMSEFSVFTVLCIAEITVKYNSVNLRNTQHRV